MPGEHFFIAYGTVANEDLLGSILLSSSLEASQALEQTWQARKSGACHLIDAYEDILVANGGVSEDFIIESREYWRLLERRRHLQDQTL